jgi:putative sterol carrier protein
LTDNELKLINALRDDFNRRCNSDPDFKSQVCNFNKLMSFTVKDSGNTYTLRLANGQALEVQQGAPTTRPDIQTTCSLEHLMGILTGDIPPQAAIMHPKIRILGSPADLSFVKKFILKESAHLRQLISTIQA